MTAYVEKLSDLLPRESFGHNVEESAYLMRRLSTILAADPAALRTATDGELRVVVGIVKAGADRLDEADDEIAAARDSALGLDL